MTPARLSLLQSELGLFTFGDLIQYFPFRYEDRTLLTPIAQINDQMENVQFIGRIKYKEKIGVGRRERLVAECCDETGCIELVWFQGVKWIEKSLVGGVDFLFYGKPGSFNGQIQMTHPEMEVYKGPQISEKFFQPIYPLTEKLRKKYVDSKLIASLQKNLLEVAFPYIRETLPHEIIQQFKLISKQEALYHIHLPQSEKPTSPRGCGFRKNHCRLYFDVTRHRQWNPGLFVGPHRNLSRSTFSGIKKVCRSSRGEHC